MEKETAAATTATAAVRVCRWCKEKYTPSGNTLWSCRFHPSFVCHRHDDQKRYYKLKDGDLPYAAKFYGCCNTEAPNAASCATRFHLSYDDPDNY